jgi:hypothetical protein
MATASSARRGWRGASELSLLVRRGRVDSAPGRFVDRPGIRAPGPAWSGAPARADWLGHTEPSTSRMVGVLAEEGLLEVTRVAGAGNRRHLELTAEGAALVKRASRLLEGRFVELVKRSGVSHASYQSNTRRLLSQLDAETQAAPSRGRAA